MRLMIWVGDEGPTDLDLKDGDIWAVYPDTWVPGDEETKIWLVIQVNPYGGEWDELTRKEFALAETLEAEPTVRHMRKYYVPYWDTLNTSELKDVRDKTISVPVMIGRFTLDNITRK